MLTYGLTEEQEMIKEVARKIAEEKIRPFSAQWDEHDEHPASAVEAMAQSDLFGVCIPEAYGGMGGGLMDLCIATEEIARVDGGVSTVYAASFLGLLPILIDGTEEQKKKYLTRLASGKSLAAFGLTEPEAGSDAANVQLTAVKDGDYYILNGVKHFISNGGVADIYTIVAQTNKSKGARGISMFIVEKDHPGFTFGKKEDKLGIRASQTRELIFQDCRVHKDQLIGGKEGRGFMTVMKTFDHSRPGVAAQAIGVAQGAYELAVAYAHERKQFNQSISSFQGIQWMLADMAMKTEAARALLYSVARMVDRGESGVSPYSAMAKCYCSDVAMEVTTNAVQIFGGYGYIKEYPIEKFMRDAKIYQIYEGTNQIQRTIVALQLIKEFSK